MKFILLALILFIIGSTGVGVTLNKELNINDGFAMPIGLALILFVTQLCYYPIQYFNLSFKLLAIISSMIMIIVAIITIINIKEVLKNFKNNYLVFVFISFIVFIFVFYNCFLDLDYSDSVMYLNYASQNVNIDKLNLFNLYTGKYGMEWEDLYLYQGYYHIMSYMCWIINIVSKVEYIKICTWLFGMLYSITSSMFICNFIREMKIKNKFLNITLIIFTLLFSNFYYWRVAFSYYGNTYRTLFTTMLIYYLYKWIQGHKEYYWYIPIIIGAGLASSSSSLITVFASMLCLMAYLFIAKKENAFYDLSIFVFPLVIYACVILSKKNLLVGIIVGIVALLYYIFRKNRYIRNIVKVIENFLYKNAKLKFYVILPVIVMIISFLINKFDKDFLITYSYAFQDHQKYDMVKDYSFRFSYLMDNILNVIRYIGILIILFKAKSDEDNFLKTLIIIMMLIFVNPFAVSTIAYFVASNVFYRAIEVLFNPFTEMILLLYVYNEAINIKLEKVLCIGLIIITCLGHVLSFTDNENGSYTFYINGGKEVNGLSKLEDDEVEAINYLMEYMYENPINDRQPVLISHSSGIRTYIPNAYVLFTPRDQFYPHTRLNEEFYQIAKRHRDWEDNNNIDYSNTCGYINEYGVDYLLIRYWENSEFDQASDACTFTIVETAKFKVKAVNK